MKSPSPTTSVLKSASRLIGWSFLIGGLAISLFADSLTGLGALRETLQGLGFPAGTICVAGFLLLALATVRTQEGTQQSTQDIAPSESPLRAQPPAPEASEIRNLEDRLIAELDRRHEGIKEDLQEMSALLEASLELSAQDVTDWRHAVGAEFTSHQLRPTPRRVGPQLHTTGPPTEDEEEMEMTLELEEQTADESRLWTPRTELSDLGELEDRLSGDVAVEHHDFVWDFPKHDSQEPVGEPTTQARETGDEDSQDTGEDYDPAVDPESIGWFDWDEEDLV